MILGIGVDIVSIDRIARLLDKYGRDFELRWFTAIEVAQSVRQNPAQYYAKRFAAKEAFVKAVGLGMRNGLNFRGISINNDELGKPYIALEPGPQALLDRILGPCNIHISLSDERSYAVASVVIESKK